MSIQQNKKTGHESDKQPMKEAPQMSRATEHPLEAASLINKLFFGWMLTFVWRCWRFRLKQSDVSTACTNLDSCERVGKKLLASWNEELSKRPLTSSQSELKESITLTANIQSEVRGRMFRAVLRTHARSLIINSAVLIFAEVGCRSLCAYSVGQILFYINDRVTDTQLRYNDTEIGNVSSTIWSFSDPLVYWTWVLIASSFVCLLAIHNFGFQMMRLGLQVRLGCSYLIYRKLLLLDQSNSGHEAISKVINILSSDLERFNYSLLFLPYIWVAPFQAIVTVYLLWPLLGKACFGAISVFFVLIPVQYHLSKLYTKYRGRISVLTEERVQVLNEIITSLRLIKLYAWEAYFRDTMHQLRAREMKQINRVNIIKGFSNALMQTSAKLVLLVTISIHLFVSDQLLDTKTLFMSMFLLFNVQLTLTQLIPRAVNLGSESLVSLRRVEEFLLTEEFEPSKKLKLKIDNSSKFSFLSPMIVQASCNSMNRDIDKLLQLLNKDQQVAIFDGSNIQSKPFIELDKVAASWLCTSSNLSKAIEGLTFRCEAPELVIVCGQVASGKSSLLMSLLNELPICEGKAIINGSLGYSSQVAWIFNGTVKDNIVFGEKFNEKRYKQVIEVCALERDLQLLGPHKDLTYIQENSLSGGQKARVSLARCIYRDTDIYLLDDPFSAIDEKVANHIFSEAIKRFLKFKLVILTSNQVGLLKRGDKILILDKGKQLAYCTFVELRASVAFGENTLGLDVEQTEWLEEFTKYPGQETDNSVLMNDVNSDEFASFKTNTSRRNNKGDAIQIEKLESNKKSIIKEEILHDKFASDDVDASPKMFTPGKDSMKGTMKLDELFQESRGVLEEKESAFSPCLKDAKVLCKPENKIEKSHYITSSVLTNVRNKTTNSEKKGSDAILNSEKVLDVQGPDEEKSTIKGTSLTIWYKYYTQSSIFRLIVMILLFITTAMLHSFNNFYLTVWMAANQNKALLVSNTTIGQPHFGMLVNEIPIDYSNKTPNHILTNEDVQYNEMFDPLRANASLALMSALQAKGLEDVLPDIAMTGNKYHTNEMNSSGSQNSILSQAPLLKLDKSNLNLTYEIKSTETRIIESSNRDHHIDSQETYEALNVQPIYRPLYKLVSKFTSREHISLYCILITITFFSACLSNMFFFASSNKSAIYLYRKLTESALYAKITFFDQNPIGRFLNRATNDTNVIDDQIPYNAIQAYEILLLVVTAFIMVSAVNYHLMLPSLAVFILILTFYFIIIESTKDVKRLEGISRSSIITHISTSLTGLQTIRATKAENYFEKSFVELQDAHTSVYLLLLGCNRIMAVILDSLNSVYIAIVGLIILVFGLSGPTAGLVLVNAISLTGLMQHGFIRLSDTQSLMTSVEQVLEYSKLPQEESYSLKERRTRKDTSKTIRYRALVGTFNSLTRKRSWPSKGCVEYRHVDLYYDTKRKPVLKNLSFKIDANEKVAIIGRTGAGKSSIVTTLFRLYDFQGTILIDGRDIKSIPLYEVRSALGIIPQTPILFSTSIRKNLDPTDSHNDCSLWAALDKAHLRTTVDSLPGKLDYNIKNGGSNFSTGQKQLMCLARVLLKKCSLVVMDEATANVDPITDALIQCTIRSEFKECTVITIAHRLESILDYDRIMVLEAGQIVDYDTPERLMVKKDGYLVSQLQESLMKGQ